MLSERLAGRFLEVLRENLGSQAFGDSVEEFMRRLPELPEDTAAWVMGEIE